MGQQQLLLIVLGVIIVGIAVVVGLTLFQNRMAEMNRNALINDVVNLASKAQRHYKVSSYLGGGCNQDFDGLTLSIGEQENNNGSFRFTTPAASATKVLSAPSAVVGNTIVPASSSTTTLYITGYGTEKGDDGVNLVQVYATVTGNSLSTSVVN